MYIISVTYNHSTIYNNHVYIYIIATRSGLKPPSWILKHILGVYKSIKFCMFDCFKLVQLNVSFLLKQAKAFQWIRQLTKENINLSKYPHYLTIFGWLNPVKPTIFCRGVETTRGHPSLFQYFPIFSHH